MLDGAHATLGGTGDGLGRIGVGTDVAPEGVCFLDGRGYLSWRELETVERIVGRGDTTRHHDLDVIAALPHLLARRLAHLVGAIRYLHGENHGIAAIAATAAVRAPATVAVPAGRADGAAGNEQPWAGHDPLLNRCLQSPVGAARVPHGRKPTIERGPHKVNGPRRHQRQRDILELPDVDLGQTDVHVCVDQAGHQGALAAIDDRSIVRPDRPGRDLLDLVAFDQQLIAAAHVVLLGIEQLEILQQDLCHRSRPPRCQAPERLTDPMRRQQAVRRDRPRPFRTAHRSPGRLGSPGPMEHRFAR